MTFNLIIPMAGAGSRFAEQGYANPKPLVDVNGFPMFVRATDNVIGLVCAGVLIDNIIFIIDSEMDRKYNIQDVIRKFYPKAKIVSLSERTQGAACTVRAAAAYLDPDSSIITANCDQLVEVDSTHPLSFKQMIETHDSGMSVFYCKDRNPKWSYAEVDEHNNVIRVAEKNPISDLATVGIYYWKTAKMLFDSIDNMMQADDRVNNEFYLCPAFNYTIAAEHSCGIHIVDQMHGLGTPEDLQTWLAR